MKSLSRFIINHRCILVKISVAIALLITIKWVWVIWACHGIGTWDGEKTDIIGRRNYLFRKVIVNRDKLIDEMPDALGPQFKGEWALYTCSMFAQALANIARIYPETEQSCRKDIKSLIEIVMSPGLRKYDADRWGEDPLGSLSGNRSHISYISHLAWMISNYRTLGGKEYDGMFDSLCETMGRRISNSPSMMIQTYPGEPIYIPDMLVAIVALHRYSLLHGGCYDSLVSRWLGKARKEWTDKKTGLLVSMLNADGSRMEDAPVKGSYSALSCYYLTLIDGDGFGLDQFDRFLGKFLDKGVLLTGVRENDFSLLPIGFDVDAGPVILGAQPIGNGFQRRPDNILLHKRRFDGHTPYDTEEETHADCRSSRAYSLVARTKALPPGGLGFGRRGRNARNEDFCPWL